MYDWFQFRLIDFPLSTLSPCAISTFLALSSQQDDEGTCAMSYASLGRVTGFARRTTIEAVKQLVDSNLIHKRVDEKSRGPVLISIRACSSVGVGNAPTRLSEGGEAA